jgi:hypothetical protein
MTKKNGLGFVYSCENKGHIGISKVILSFGEFQYPYNDWKGEYGMSQICYGLKINNKDEGDCIVNAINSNIFKNILKYTKWSTFQTDWRMFKYFKKDFYKHFLNNNIENTNENMNISNINDYEIIKDGRKKYYLIEDKLYKVKKDKSIGDHIGSYIDNQIIYN